ncbi:hypothetical protein [Paracoccus sp. ME4]|uniref:hypothetical protein n=1 Tax=Paracoccus sp. ME4 TaxID=3138066 RepID=UPI00398B34C7
MIVSTKFGPTRLSGKDADAFRWQLREGGDRPARAALARGVQLAAGFAADGRVVLPASPAWTEHRSAEDASVNWTRPTPDGGMLECRYVRRRPEYFIAYVSAHSGCRHACRFCHLTQTGQTTFRETPLTELEEQLSKVFDHYDRLDRPARRVNINFMTRGEPLSSRVLLDGFGAFATIARRMAEARGLEHRINLSTIFPQDAAGVDLAGAFGEAPVRIYWSLYSLDRGFRKRWLPRAQDPQRVMAKLLEWQARAHGEVVLHWALIDGENDADRDLSAIAEFVRENGLRAKLNLVRYNPHSPKTGREALEARYEAALRIVGAAMSEPGSKVVSRVGFDVKASCGMFM